MSSASEEPGFAPSDLTDGREPLDWQSKYTDVSAQKGIRNEAIYLGLLLAAVPTLMLGFWLTTPLAWLGIPAERHEPIVKYALAWLGGSLGGTLFALKWLYHSVAHKKWHLDRRLWRIFTPHISGGLAFAVMALLSSGLLSIFSQDVADSLSLVVGISFLVGYFSDSAIAKLSEVAETFFGASRRFERQKDDQRAIPKAPKSEQRP